MVSVEKDIMYLPPIEFTSLYPLKGKLSSGSYGTVYYSDNNMLVKKFNPDFLLQELCNELDAYSIYRHECILTPAAWSVLDGVGFLALEKGIDIMTAYNRGLISIRNIISDTLSAVSFLHSNGRMHGDIKLANMVYCNGRCKLIDMGMSKQCLLNEDGDYYSLDTAYISMYRDPELVDKEYNNIKCEMYALSTVYVSLLTEREQHRNNYESGDPAIDWLLTECEKPWRDRLGINQLITSSPTPLILCSYSQCRVLPDKITPTLESIPLCYVMEWLTEVCYVEHYSARTLFLGLHLIHRAYGSISPSREEWQIFGSAAMAIANNVVQENYITTVKRWAYLSDSEDDTSYNNRFQDFIVKILQTCKGIISDNTYWDYASCKEDLPLLLEDTINCNYDTSLIRESIHTEKNNKNVLVRDLLPENIKFPYKDKGSMWRETTFTCISTVKPCYLDIKLDFTRLEKYWTAEDYDNCCAILIRNKDSLYSLRLNLALSIYYFLYKARYASCEVLNILFGKELPEPYYCMAGNLHPFCNNKRIKR